MKSAPASGWPARSSGGILCCDEVTNSVDRSSPPNTGQVTNGVGSSTSNITAPSGSKRRTDPPWKSASHTQPSLSIVRPSGKPSSASIVAQVRTFSTSPVVTS